MARLSIEDARRVLADWMASFAKAADIDQWYAHVTDRCTEFHPIYPALIEAPMFRALQGARFGEPPRYRGPRATFNDDVIRVYEDVILRVSAGVTTRLETNGTVSRHLNRETFLFVRQEGRWLMAHNHVSPAGNDFPYGHNQFAGGALQYGGGGE
jgi:ketosteroid isomerase-like protein